MTILRISPMLLLLGLLALSSAAAEPFPDRWFYASHGLDSDEQLATLCSLVDTAADSGYNGMLLSSLSLAYRWPEERKERLRSLKRHCDERGIEIVPSVWSPGYGAMLGANLNLMEGVPVRNVPMTVENRRAVFRPEQNDRVPNGGFEDPARKPSLSPPGWTFVDGPGSIAFRDTEVRHSGEASLRMENFASDKHGHGRAMLTFRVQPHRQYRFSAWVKTEGLAPAQNLWTILFYDKDEDVSLLLRHGMKPTQDWTKIWFPFTSGDTEECRIYIGMWEGKSGRFWLDDVAIEELGIVAPIRRHGTPVTVRESETGRVLAEGTDYEPLPGVTRWHPPEDLASLDLKLNASLPDGTRLLVDYYTPPPLQDVQHPSCMSDPEYYELCRQSAAFIDETLHPAKWFLDLDEIRAGGTCHDCETRNTDMAHILADCAAKLAAIVRDVHPGATLYSWSDMFDPKHNAHDRYYACKGTYSGSWDLIPKDVVVVCWHGGIRDESLSFFSGHGFRTMAAAYYDADDLQGSRDWLEACRKTPDCRGLMYTTWENKYGLLEPFGRELFLSK